MQRHDGEQIYEYLVSYMACLGYAPTVREIGRAVGVDSTSVIVEHLERLHEVGRIRRTEGVARGIEVIGETARR